MQFPQLTEFALKFGDLITTFEMLSPFSVNFAIVNSYAIPASFLGLQMEPRHRMGFSKFRHFLECFWNTLDSRIISNDSSNSSTPTPPPVNSKQHPVYRTRPRGKFSHTIYFCKTKRKMAVHWRLFVSRETVLVAGKDEQGWGQKLYIKH